MKEQKRILAELDWMDGRRVAGIKDRYRAGVIDPLVKRIESGKSTAGLLKAIGAGLVREMDGGALEEALGDGIVQAGLIGRTTIEEIRRLHRLRRGESREQSASSA